MRPRLRQAFLFFSSLTLMFAATGNILPRVAAEDAPNWLAPTAPVLSKVVDLPADVAPSNHAVRCTEIAYLPKGHTVPQHACTFLSPVGTLTTTGLIQAGTNEFVPLYGPASGSTFIPTEDSSLALVAFTTFTMGDKVGMYRGLSKADLHKVSNAYEGTYYRLEPKFPPIWLTDSTGEPLRLNTLDMVFSANGEWMVANAPGQGLVRVHMTDFSAKLFTTPLEPEWYPEFGMASPPLAISDDGHYVAANTDIWGTGNLQIYDLSTCSDQFVVDQFHRTSCSGKNILHGTDLTGHRMDGGLVSQYPGLEYPTHLQFVSDDSLSFSARYDVVSGQEFKAASFVATAPNTMQHKLGLLGMGDSYISGQGAFEYVTGTDTSNNPCHLSKLSYPFILGHSSFDSYNSVACSGALTGNVIGNSGKYTGQVKDKIEEQYRDKPHILANFLPGYIYQQEFASAYQPEAILLSVGGDDVGFADIVKACVANTGGGTCYDTYEDRAELVNEIDGVYAKLVHTYTTLRDASGGARVYVVGYPQIAKVGGNCGLNVHLNAAEIGFSAQLIDYLDGVVRQAAQTAGVFYVDTQHAFDGHRLCEAGNKAMNALTAGNDAGISVRGHQINLIGAESYHPTTLGYQLLAKTIAAQTKKMTAPMPTPTKFSVPTFDTAAPILAGVPVTGRPIRWTTHDDMIASDFVLRGDAQLVTVNGADLQLQPGSRYQIVLHSTPIFLDEGSVNADGNITTTVHIPTNVEPGYHVVHVYGTNMAGEPVDVQKVLYVAVSVDDYDGDGIPNTANACLVVSPSGQDADQDGIDDACDPVITDPPADQGAVPTSFSVSPVARQQSNAVAQAGKSGVVLGETISGNNAVGSQQTGIMAAPVQELFRLNWLVVLAAGLGLTISAAMVNYRLRAKR